MGEYTIQIIGHTQVPPWVSFLNANRFGVIGQKPRSLNIDLTNMNFIAPYHVVSLACLIEEYYMKGVIIRFRQGSNVATEYLENLGFFHYWEKDFDRKKYHTDKIKTSFCLWQLDKEMFNAYVMYAKDYFNRHFFNGLDLEPLNTSLTELFNNVVDHSESAIGGYIFTQYFPKKNQIVISLCDFGNGIPNTINRFLEKTKKKACFQYESPEIGLKKRIFDRIYPLQPRPGP
jgi:anti-sigma regulatory factor (Ser/Thr protein kinase)